MATRIYNFEFRGTAANNQTWWTTGTVEDNANDIMAVFNTAMRLSFQQVTQGRAIYGQPGIGCHGPYDIERIHIEKADASKPSRLSIVA